MRTKPLICLVIITLGLVIFGYASAETIQVNYPNLLLINAEAVEAFVQKHPEATIVSVDPEKNVWYGSTSELATALIARTLQSDIFPIETSVNNWNVIMEKGFCLDLSSSELLMDAINQMYPQIRELLMKDGHLYAWPQGFTFTYMQVVEDVWCEVGYTLEDVPKSFPALLDFLETWCDRVEADPYLNVRVMGGLQEQPMLTPDFYSSWLLELLMKEIVMQQQYAGKPLSFGDANTVALMQRCLDVGARIVALESNSSSSLEGLFFSTTWNVLPDTETHIVYLRLDEAQPMLTRAYVDLLAVYAGTEHPELCIDLLECLMTNPSPYLAIDQFCYPDAEPRYMLGYEENLAEAKEKIALLTEQLADESLTLEEREALEVQLERWEHSLETTESQKWKVSPESLESYKGWVDRLYFPEPSIFEETQIGSQLYSLRHQVCNGVITVEQFVKRLDELVRMAQEEAK